MNKLSCTATAILLAGSATIVFAAPPGTSPAKKSFSSHGSAYSATKPGNPAHVTDDQASNAILANALNDLFDGADKHFDQGEYNHVINLNRVVVQGDPHNMQAYSNAAWLLWSTDRTESGLALLRQGLAANTTNFYMYDELGQFYWLHLHKPALALPYYEKAVKYPCPMLTWHGLAHCYELTGHLKLAALAWEHASKIKGDRIASVQLARLRVLIAHKSEKHI